MAASTARAVAITLALALAGPAAAEVLIAVGLPLAVGGPAHERVARTVDRAVAEADPGTPIRLVSLAPPDSDAPTRVELAFHRARQPSRLDLQRIGLQQRLAGVLTARAQAETAAETDGSDADGGGDDGADDPAEAATATPAPDAARLVEALSDLGTHAATRLILVAPLGRMELPQPPPWTPSTAPALIHLERGAGSAMANDGANDDGADDDTEGAARERLARWLTAFAAVSRDPGPAAQPSVTTGGGEAGRAK